ncbi:kinase-like protein [Neocallimastix californiae]|uniref:non-specific serine/threonine protein kinase n=1 Tax=Neocallimastix californiae TaxID=1754190 RepID=A0A1Y2FRG6_9FUNG|nr:kinase-like protein [Neocallimastix californiae]|eukprot:ORY86602.1 kinase-like protein [Neocallimastix californiae]
MNNNNNFIDNELIFSKKRKLEKGKKEESYSDLSIKNHVHKPQSLLRKRISESEFNFNIPSTSINNSLIDSWRPLLNENKLTSQYQDNINEIENKNKNEYEYEKIIINEPPDVPNIEEFDEKNETYSFNRNTLQYEFIPEGMINEGNNSYLYNNYSNYNYPLPEMGASNDNGINRNIHRQESSLIPFKQDSQIILYNNNNTGQVVLYNKTNKSLSIHKIRPNSKEIMSRNNRCILCNQLLPSERERINTNNMFKNRRAYTDTKYFRLLACSLSYNRKPSITSANNNNLNESNNFSIHTVNSAENIINLLNDNSSNNTECINHPSITITTSQSNPNPDFNENINKNGIKEVDDIKNENENENENKSTENIKSDQNNGKSNTTTYLSSSSFNNGYYERFFIERKKLGRGFRGSVFLCHHILDQVFLGEYAVKKVAVGNNHQWLVRMLKEVMLLEKLRNPNIIEYKHAWLEEHTLSSFGPKVPCLFILMERANGGNLEEYVQLQWNPEEQLEKALSVKERIKRKRLRMKEAQNQIKDNRAQFFGGIGYDSFGKRVRYLTTEAIWKIFLDICYGLNHLHELGIIHRDLKPPNLLLQYKDPNNQEEIPKVLISDFGECEILSHLEKRQRTGATGTLEFMAELLISDEAGHYYDDYSSNSDLWSLGVVLYYICFSEMPYSQVDDIDILKNEILNYSTVHFKNDNNSNRVPKELKTLIKKLMIKEPTKRPKAKEILELYGGFKNDSSIRIETDSENLSNSTLNQKDPLSSIKSMTSNEIINDSKKIDEKQLPNINDKNLSPLSPCQDIPTSIPTNKFKGKEKEKEKDNEDENTNKNKNEIKNKIENDSIEEDINRSRNNNEIEEEKEWLNKELVDEPLSFNIEKRIIPFNHNRSKSLPYLLNNSKFNTNSKDNNNNGIVQDSIKEEENDNFDKEYNKKINTYPPLEKSLVPFQENKIKSFDRPLPSPTYPPLKNNDRENKYKRSYKNIWINEKDNSRELIRKEMKLIQIIMKMKKGLKQDIKNDLKQNKKNKNYNKSQTLKRKNNKKSSSYHPRHTYQNSKIYFTHLPRRTNTISIINTKNNNNGEKVSEKIKEKQLTPFKPNYSQLKVQNHNKVMKILQQKMFIYFLNND